MPVTFNGSVTIQGITDADLAMILDYKIKHPSFVFSPTILQQAPQGKYNNCVLSWNTEDGMKDARIVVHKLHNGHDREPS